MAFGMSISAIAFAVSLAAGLKLLFTQMTAMPFGASIATWQTTLYLSSCWNAKLHYMRGDERTA